MSDKLQSVIDAAMKVATEQKVHALILVWDAETGGSVQASYPTNEVVTRFMLSAGQEAIADSMRLARIRAQDPPRITLANGRPPR